MSYGIKNYTDNYDVKTVLLEVNGEEIKKIEK